MRHAAILSTPSANAEMLAQAVYVCLSQACPSTPSTSACATRDSGDYLDKSACDACISAAEAGSGACAAAFSSCTADST